MQPPPKRAFYRQAEQERTRVMQQPHTEETIEHTDGQQDTGNHKKPGAPDAGGADARGGTRAGAENVEPPSDTPKDK